LMNKSESKGKVSHEQTKEYNILIYRNHGSTVIVWTFSKGKELGISRPVEEMKMATSMPGRRWDRQSPIGERRKLRKQKGSSIDGRRTNTELRRPKSMSPKNA